MKTPLSALALALLVLPAALRGEDPPAPPPRGGAPNGERPFRHGGGPGPQVGGENADRPLVKWMEKRKEQNPEEFERLRKLREENPQEFRRHLLNRFSQERVSRVLEKFPDVREALQRIPPERQKDFFLALIEPGPFPMEGGPGNGPADGHGRPPNNEGKRELPNEVRELIRQHRESTNEADKTAVAREIREHVAEFYGKRVKERQAQLERMEQELLRMRRELEEQTRNRDQAVEERVRGLLQK